MSISNFCFLTCIQVSQEAGQVVWYSHLMRNAGLEETQAGIKISWRNINNLRYADGTTLIIESEEELKSLLIKVKERVKHWLKTQQSEK